MQKKFVYAALLLAVATESHAVDGMGNVRFTMTKKQVEAQGYICAPIPKDPGEIKCQHLDLQGSVYGYPTKNYRVYFGVDKKIYQISADFSGIKSMENYFDILSKLEVQFPIEDKAESDSEKGVYVRYLRRNSSNAAGSILMFLGVPGVVPTNYTISYLTPELMAAKDKRLREEMLRKQSLEGEAQSEK